MTTTSHMNTKSLLAEFCVNCYQLEVARKYYKAGLELLENKFFVKTLKEWHKEHESVKEAFINLLEFEDNPSDDYDFYYRGESAYKSLIIDFLEGEF